MKNNGVLDNALDRAADVLDLPDEYLRSLPRVTVTGCRRVFVENHCGILEYGENEIDVNGGRVVLCIRGSGLTLRGMTRGELLITGSVSGVEIKN